MFLHKIGLNVNFHYSPLIYDLLEYLFLLFYSDAIINNLIIKVIFSTNTDISRYGHDFFFKKFCKNIIFKNKKFSKKFFHWCLFISFIYIFINKNDKNKQYNAAKK